MAKGGKRKGSGRKATGKVAMLVRVAPETRTRLEREAKQKRQSLSAVAERHLTDALYGQPVDPQTRALCYLITRIPMIARTFARKADFEFTWRTNRFDFEVLRYVVNYILDGLAPAGAVEGGRYGGLNDYMARVGIDNPHEDEDSPTVLGNIIAGAIVASLALRDVLYAEGERSGAASGSDYYALPQATRDLGIAARDPGWAVLRDLGFTGEDK